MNNFMKSASSLTLIAALAATPFSVAAQTATDDATAESPAVTENTAQSDDTTIVPEAESDTETAEEADAPEADAEMDTAQGGDATEAPGADAEMDTAQGGDATDAPDAEMDTAQGGDATVAPEADAEMDTAQGGDATVAPEADAEMDTAQGGDAAVAPEADMNTAEVAEEQVQPVEGQIMMQDENTILANDLIGSDVYAPSGEAIGEIDDLIVSLEGSVDGVVIGVGGFLGLGEKDVAIKMASLSVSTGENGDTRLVSSATRADLEAAEPFVTKDEMAAVEQSLETMPADDAAVGDPASN